MTQGPSVVTLTYDAAGRRSTLTLPNGIVTTYGYDDANQVTSLTYTLGETTLGTLTYTYDAAGRRTAVGGTWARTGLPQPMAGARYDPATRVQAWAGQIFSFDPNGNLASDGLTSYSWNARNQLFDVGPWVERREAIEKIRPALASLRSTESAAGELMAGISVGDGSIARLRGTRSYSPKGHRMRLVFALTACAAVLVTPSVSASTITFSEPSVAAQLANTYVGTTVMYYSDPLTSFAIDGVTFTPNGIGSRYEVLRSTFDDRLPYPYDFISGNVMQVASSGLDVSFLSPVSEFGFGAALNATAAPSHMRVELLGLGDTSLGVFDLLLDRTVLSISGGTNSHSEGRFVAPAVGLIAGARLTNFGDGTADGSQLH